MSGKATILIRRICALKVEFGAMDTRVRTPEVVDAVLDTRCYKKCRTAVCRSILFASLIINTAVKANDAAYGEYLSSSCLSCHSLNDRSQALPPLSGYGQQNMVNLLTAYRDAENLNPAMQNVAKSLSDDDIQALALYFSQLPQ